MRRPARQFVLFAASVITCLAFYAAFRGSDPVWRLSMGSAYASLVLLALSLAIGPWNRLRGRPNPVSGYLRRDIGIWAGVVALFHVIVGLMAHYQGRMWLYFVAPPDAWYTYPLRPLRIDAFGIANYLGVFATFVLIMLLCLSNDASLRALGRDRWKSLQRWNYAAALLVLGHGTLYQIVEKRTWTFVAVALLIVLATFGMQIAGYRTYGKKAWAASRS